MKLELLGLALFTVVPVFAQANGQHNGCGEGSEWRGDRQR